MHFSFKFSLKSISQTKNVDHSNLYNWIFDLPYKRFIARRQITRLVQRISNEWLNLTKAMKVGIYRLGYVNYILP